MSICAICKEKVNLKFTMWICEHEFCYDCCSNWDGICPLCRAERIPPPEVEDDPDCFEICCFRYRRQRPKKCRFYRKFSGWGSSGYRRGWKKVKCLKEAHTVRLDRSDVDQVIGTCETCGKKQYYPYMG